MRTKRIELEGNAGHVAIERQNGETQFRIDSIIRDPIRGQQAWKTWELPADISNEDLFKVAIEVQFRTNGFTGTNSNVHDYFREMQRFQD